LQALRKKQSTRGEHRSTAEHHFHFAKETGDIHPGIEKHGENPDNEHLLRQTVTAADDPRRRSYTPAPEPTGKEPNVKKTPDKGVDFLPHAASEVSKSQASAVNSPRSLICYIGKFCQNHHSSCQIRSSPRTNHELPGGFSGISRGGRRGAMDERWGVFCHGWIRRNFLPRMSTDCHG
jgi:hypothetical protein